MFIMPNLLINDSKLALKIPLVKISIVCCVKGTKGMQIALQSIFFFMKCLLIFTCFVRLCCIGLCAILIIALLSQYNFIGTFCKTRGNSNFLRNGKIVISIKIRNFSRFWMTKKTSSLESSREI